MTRTRTKRGPLKALRTSVGKILTSMVFFSALISQGASSTQPVNKLLYMYRIHYLPFNLDFREGSGREEILPYVISEVEERLITAEELFTLDRQWLGTRQSWSTRSLLLSTNVSVNQSSRISGHLVSHRIALSRKALDGVPLDERIRINQAIQGKSKAVQLAFKQLRFLKSLLTQRDEGQFNFFIIAPHWCESSQHYRVILETLAKTFPNPQLNLHSVVIEDPKEKIFESPLMRELFPHPERYSHDTVPRFLAHDTRNGISVVLEEGAALKELYGRFFEAHRGFLSKGNPTLQKGSVQTPAPLSNQRK